MQINNKLFTLNSIVRRNPECIYVEIKSFNEEDQEVVEQMGIFSKNNEDILVKLVEKELKQLQHTTDARLIEISDDICEIIITMIHKEEGMIDYYQLCISHLPHLIGNEIKLIYENINPDSRMYTETI